MARPFIWNVPLHTVGSKRPGGLRTPPGFSSGSHIERKVSASFPFRTISAFSAVSPPFESCEIDKQDQQQEHQQFHTSLPFRRASVIALLMPIALLVPLPRVSPPRLASTSAKQRMRVASVGVLRV